VPGARAQTDAARAAAIADGEAAEERYRLLKSAVDGMLTSQMDQQRRLDTLAEDLRRVRSEATPAAGDYVTREELNRVLQEMIREIDRKREADKKMILEEIENLGKTLSASLKASARRPEPAAGAPAAPKGGTVPSYQEYAEHTVERGQTISAIVAAYNEEYRKKGKRTASDLIMKANPKLKKPEDLQVGQKLVIPLVPS
jgi:hypothetical protein